ncbi:MAG: hypothetical protein ACFKPT_00460 [Gloeotrichia echinulata GP01]
MPRPEAANTGLTQVAHKSRVKSQESRVKSQGSRVKSPGFWTIDF